MSTIEIKEESRHINSDIKSISANGIINIVYTVSEKSSILIKARKEYMRYIETRTIDGKLTIQTNMPLGMSIEGEIYAYITSPSLISINLSGCANANVSLGIGKTFQANLRGCADLKASGEIEKSLFDMSGTSIARCKKLITESISLKMAGTSQAKVYASNHFAATLSGISEIKLLGNPLHKNISKSGISSVKIM